MHRSPVSWSSQIQNPKYQVFVYHFGCFVFFLLSSKALVKMHLGLTVSHRQRRIKSTVDSFLSLNFSKKRKKKHISALCPFASPALPKLSNFFRILFNSLHLQAPHGGDLVSTLNDFFMKYIKHHVASVVALKYLGENYLLRQHYMISRRFSCFFENFLSPKYLP